MVGEMTGGWGRRREEGKGGKRRRDRGSTAGLKQW